MNIYLDIDGVILANDKQPALHVQEFLEHITGRYPIFWLTTHCKGNADDTVAHLSRILDSSTLALTKAIRATNWDMAKTEAIDFSMPFLWLDDDLFEFERAELVRHNVLKSWVEIDLSRNQNQLRDIIRDKIL